MCRCVTCSVFYLNWIDSATFKWQVQSVSLSYKQSKIKGDSAAIFFKKYSLYILGILLLSNGKLIFKIG